MKLKELNKKERAIKEKEIKEKLYQKT